MSEPIPHIIVTGNPVEGFEFIGPFDSDVDAARYGNEDPDMEEWWISPLDRP